MPMLRVYSALLVPVLLAAQGVPEPVFRTSTRLVQVDVVATEVIEPWGGGKWHLEVFRSTAAEPEDWNGEM